MRRGDVRSTRRSAVELRGPSAEWKRPPEPAQRLECPHCALEFDAAQRAVSLRCPRCSGQIQLQNAILTGIMTGNVSTLGQVRITRRGTVRGKIECGSLLVEGGLVGNVRVRGVARIDSKGSLAGSLSASSIVIEAGARLDCQLDISPRRTLDPNRTVEVMEHSHAAGAGGQRHQHSR